MEIDKRIQFNSDGKLIHFLNIEGLSKDQIIEILDIAENFIETSNKKNKNLENKTVASLFLNQALGQKLLLN